MADPLVQDLHRQTRHSHLNRIEDRDFVVDAVGEAGVTGTAEEDVHFMKIDLIVLGAGLRKDAGASLETEMNAIPIVSWTATYGRAMA